MTTRRGDSVLGTLNICALGKPCQEATNAMRTLVVNALRAAGAGTAMRRYVERLAHEWSHQATPFDRIVVAAPAAVDLPLLGQVTPVEVKVFGSRLPLVAWEQVALPFAARGAALLFCPAYTAPVAWRGRLVVANHGIYEAVPGEFPLTARLRTVPLFRFAARKADAVVVNSRATGRDMMRFFGVPESKLHVIPPAANEVFFTKIGAADRRAEVERTFGHEVPYLLFVGKMARRRNVPNLIAAFARVVAAGANHHLLLVGPDTSGVGVDELASRHGVSGRVRWLPRADHDRLAALYQGAEVFVLPTTYEGISWTMLEAMACGTAVLTAEHPTLAEGAGDTVLVVPTPSVENITDGLSRLLADPGLRERLGAAGRARAASFSWADAARRTMEICDRVADPRDRTDRS